MTLKDTMEEQAKELREVRDELRVKLHLGAMEARDLWEELEKEWDQAEGKLKVLSGAGQEAAEEVGEATKVVLDKVKEGYEKLRNLL
jgi:hypothetical protein